MRSICVANVGDGLCMYITTRNCIQIDWGSQDGSCVAFKGLMECHKSSIECCYPVICFPNAFILSHFHIDHYNGLLYASVIGRPFLPIERVYYPGIPEFKESREFMEALFTINMRVFGEETGVMEYDFLKAIEKISFRPFGHKSLFRDEKIIINGLIFKVLWPPRIVKEDDILMVVRKALKAFRKALEEDDEIRRLYRRVKRENIFDLLYEGGGFQKKEFFSEKRYYYRKTGREKLPEVVREANKALRRAANHLSLVLLEDNIFLFLGDIEGFEIKQIVKDLISECRKNFYILITPHHGTHWHDSLRKINCIYSISSCGKKLYSKIKSQFRQISQKSFYTRTDGTIFLSFNL